MFRVVAFFSNRFSDAGAPAPPVVTVIYHYRSRISTKRRFI